MESTRSRLVSQPPCQAPVCEILERLVEIEGEADDVKYYDYDYDYDYDHYSYSYNHYYLRLLL